MKYASTNRLCLKYFEEINVKENIYKVSQEMKYILYDAEIAEHKEFAEVLEIK